MSALQELERIKVLVECWQGTKQRCPIQGIRWQQEQSHNHPSQEMQILTLIVQNNYSHFKS